METGLQKIQNQWGAALAEKSKTITSILPKHMDQGRFLRMALNALVKNPDLAKCNKDSFVMAVINLAEMGLEPSLGQAALIPYGKAVQCQPMYQGLIDLARRSGQISTIYAEAVGKDDQFTYELGLDPILKHTPNPEGSGDLIYVYAVAKMKDGGTQFVVLTKAEVEKVKASSRSAGSKSSPWNTWPAEMWKKTAVKRLCKFLPKSTEMQKAVEMDNMAESGQAQYKPPVAMTSNVMDTPDGKTPTVKAGKPVTKGKGKPAPKPKQEEKPVDQPDEEPPPTDLETEPEDAGDGTPEGGPFGGQTGRQAREAGGMDSPE